MQALRGDAEPADAILLTRARKGDVEALSQLYRRHHALVFRFARAMTGSMEAAADIVQDVFVALAAGLNRYDASRAALSTYLHAMARNHSRNWLRRQRRYRIEQVHDMSECDSPTAERQIQRRELAALVRRALRSVPPRHREVLVLCDLQDLSYAEAAVVLNISVAAVRSRLHRGRHLLRVHFERIAHVKSARDIRSVV